MTLRVYTCCAQVKELLHPYGMLKAFNLVMDKHTGNSKVRGVVCHISVGCIHVGHGCCGSQHFLAFVSVRM